MNSARKSIHESPNKMENGELANSVRQSIRRALDSIVEDA